MVSLTSQQAKLFAFIKSQVEATGIAPSYTEMLQHMGTKSRGRMHAILTNLEERGRIRRVPRLQRAIEIVETQCPHCGKAL